MISKYVIILNPIAAKGGAEKKLPFIHNFFTQSQAEYQIILTQHPGHGINLAEEFSKQKNSVIIAAGGDGTCNEIVNGLMKMKKGSRPVMGVLPIGRGNDFAYGASIPANLNEALKTIIHKHIMSMDAGFVQGGDYPEGRYFANGIGVGFDTIVGLEAAKLKHVHGAAAYIISALKTLIKYPESPEIEISYNDERYKLNAVQISIMNGKRMGGVFFMAPAASNNDGFLNLCMSSRVSRRKLLKTMLQYTKGQQHTMPNIIIDKAEAFTIKALKGTLAVHADGETICTEGKELKLTCKKDAIQIICKKEGL